MRPKLTSEVVRQWLHDTASVPCRCISGYYPAVFDVILNAAEPYKAVPAGLDMHIVHHLEQEPRPFTWTKTAGEILSSPAKLEVFHPINR